jgi:hypothetical protein
MKLILKLGHITLGKADLSPIEMNKTVTMYLDEKVLRQYVEEIARWTQPGRLGGR